MIVFSLISNPRFRWSDHDADQRWRNRGDLDVLTKTCTISRFLDGESLFNMADHASLPCRECEGWKG